MNETKGIEGTRELSEDVTAKAGHCIYCGQMVVVNAMQDWSEDEINQAATSQCECDAAQSYIKAQRRKEKAKKRIHELFGSAAEKPIAEEVVDILLLSVDAIEEKTIKSLTVDIGQGAKGKIIKTAKENIRVERSESKKTTFEE